MLAHLLLFKAKDELCPVLVKDMHGRLISRFGERLVFYLPADVDSLGLPCSTAGLVTVLHFSADPHHTQ